MVKERSQIQIAAILISGITGVSCAYHGWGYWGNCRTDRCVCQHQHYPALDILSLQAYFFVPLSPILELYLSQ